MDNNIKAFDNYANNFDLNETAIKRKYEHSHRVMKISTNIARYLKLNDKDTYLATLIGLIHDFGRFEQWKQYKTYSDYKSVDHALLGAKLLFDDGLINVFDLANKDYELVRTAIENHSVYELDKNKIKNKTLLHSKIIRDADKVDIIYQISKNNLLGLDEDNSEISSKVKEEFYNHKCINKKDKKTANDNVVMKIALVYGLNFDYSKEVILKNNYLDRMFESLNNKDIFKPYIAEAKKYLKGSR